MANPLKPIAVESFSQFCSQIVLKTSTVKDWRSNPIALENHYLKLDYPADVAKQLARNEFLRPKKLGAPTFLDAEDHEHFLDLLIAIRKAGGSVTFFRALCVAEALVINIGKALTLDNQETGEDELKLSVRWARNVIEYQLNYRRKKATTDRSMNDDQLQVAATEMQAVCERSEVYDNSLVMMMDETMAPWQCANDSTWAEKGSKRVQIKRSRDKRGCTVTFSVTKSGFMLSYQVIWAGTTPRPVDQDSLGVLCTYSSPSSKQNSKGTK
ncbi:hypothetical protein RCL1_007295 [Eukaryota sp. TZLM3-RCL]